MISLFLSTTFQTCEITVDIDSRKKLVVLLYSFWYNPLQSSMMQFKNISFKDTRNISLFQEVAFRLPSLHTSIYSTSFPLLPTSETQTASPGGSGEATERLKHQSTEGSPSPPGPPPLHQQLNIVEICVILLIGASAAIGKSALGSITCRFSMALTSL